MLEVELEVARYPWAPPANIYDEVLECVKVRHTHANKEALDYLSYKALSGGVQLLVDGAQVAFGSDIPAQLSTTHVQNTLNGVNVSPWIPSAYLTADGFKILAETLRADYATKDLVSSIPKFAIAVVSELPTENVSGTTVYLLKDAETGGNLYTEYIYINGGWEILGTQKVDLSNYISKDEFDSRVSEKIEQMIADGELCAGERPTDTYSLVNYGAQVDSGTLLIYSYEEELPRGTEIADVEVSIEQDAWVSLKDMIEVDCMPYCLMMDKVFYNEMYGSIVAVVHFPTDLSGNFIGTAVTYGALLGVKVTYYTD